MCHYSQVMLDRGAEPIPFSADGTYRLLSVNGKNWPMINGGPCTNYYNGHDGGGGSEYSTTVINCCFQFCRVECEMAYVSFFDTVKDSLAQGDAVYVRGFGSFVNKHRAAKKARNISAKTTVMVAAHSVPGFKPAKEFTEQVKSSVK